MKVIKDLLPFVVGAASFIGVFMLTSIFINWLTHDISNNDVKQVVRVILWILGFAWTTVIGIALGAITGSFTNDLITRKRNKKYVTKR